MKSGDLVILKKSHASPPGLVVEVKAESTGDWALVMWLHSDVWHNWRDLEVVSEIG